jgi:hypothetical protein
VGQTSLERRLDAWFVEEGHDSADDLYSGSEFKFAKKTYLEDEVNHGDPGDSFVKTGLPWSEVLVVGAEPDLSGDEEEPDDVHEEGEQEQDDHVNLLFLWRVRFKWEVGSLL